MLSLREMQSLAEAEYSVEDTRSDLERIAQFYKGQSYQEEALKVLADARQLPVEVLKEAGCFYVSDEAKVSELPEDLQAESLGMVFKNYIVYAGRLVYPVYDVKGQIMGFCGWDKYAKPKYLDSKNHGYKAKITSFYGMERMFEYYRSRKPIFVVEGIVCCLYLRSKGFQAVSTLGSSMSPYVIEIFKRVQDRIIFIPDNDIIGKEMEEINDAKPAGEHYVKQIKRVLPKARVIQSIIEKDVDDTRKLNNGQYEQDFLKDLQQVAVCPFFMFKTIRVR